MAGREVYLDHNATSPVRPAVIQVIQEALQVTGNPSSVHRAGRAARRLLEDARRVIADAMDAPAEGVIFTSGGSEANNLALSGLVPAGSRLFVSAIEHESVLEAAGDNAVTVPVTPDGLVDPETLDHLLASQASDGKPALVAIMAANNETGVIQPVEAISSICKQHKAVFHCDAVQIPGRHPFTLASAGADSISLAAHKLGGPAGVGALLLAPGRSLHRPLIRGGGQERRRRAGTENVAGIAGFAEAMRIALAQAEEEQQRLKQLQDRLERGLATQQDFARAQGCGDASLPRIIAGTSLRLPGTACLLLPGIKGQTQLMTLDLAGICVSTGSACSSGKVTESRVLKAMGLDSQLAGCAIRVSAGHTTTEADIDAFLLARDAMLRKLWTGKPPLLSASA